MIGRIRQLSHVQTFSVLAVVVLLAAVGITVTISQQQQVARNQASTTSSGISTDTTSSAHADGVSSLSWTQTVNSHLNQVLIVTVSTYEHITSSVTYNGVSMTKIGNATCLSTCNASMWYLLNPPTGSHSVVTKLSGTTSVVGGAATYYNVDQSNPFGSIATTNGKSTTASVSVSSTQSQLIIDSYTNENHGGTPASGQTQVYEDNTVNAGGSSYKNGSAGSTTMTWNGKSSTSENWALLGVPMNGLSSTTSVPVVNSLVLWNAQTNAAITTLSNNATVDLSTVGTSCLNIRAMTTPSTVGSVVFAYDGNTSYRTENNAPYDLGGDATTGDTPSCMTFAPGLHVLAATPYGGSNGSGQLGLPALISFTVVNQSSSPTATPPPGIQACGTICDGTHACGSPVAVSGKIVDANNNPVNGLNVVIYDHNRDNSNYSTATDTVKTDGNGNFSEKALVCGGLDVNTGDAYAVRPNWGACIPGSSCSAANPNSIENQQVHKSSDCASSNSCNFKITLSSSSSCGLVVTTPVTLDKSTIAYNDTIHGTVTYTNTCSSSINVQDIVIASRTSTGSNVDLSGNGGSMTIQPGQNVTISASKAIANGAPLGQWYAFASYQDTSGNWHEDQNKVYYSVVSAISATATPAPTSPAATAVPTQTPAPTTPPAAGDTILGFDLLLHGIGKAGDNANPQGTGNTSPTRTQRTATVQVYDSNNNLVATNQGPVTYDTNSGSFKGTVDLGQHVSTGAYTVKVKTDQYLRALVPGIQTLTAGQTNQLPQFSMVVGDINDDNQINILDYNILMGCYSDLLPPVSCAAGNDVLSDLDSDGHVNQFDYNLFLRELSNSTGQ
jgi:hypothetical protein